MRLTETQTMYVRSMGKALRVTAIFDNDDAANAHMAKNDEDAVVAVFGKFVLLANRCDRGVDIRELSKIPGAFAA